MRCVHPTHVNDASLKFSFRRNLPYKVNQFAAEKELPTQVLL
jgi:hypothetical protein